jgi:hypothetical protein
VAKKLSVVMENLSKLAKFFLFLTMAAFALWFGSYITRMTLSLQLFQGTHFELKDIVKRSNFDSIVLSLAPAIAISVVSYCAMVVLFILFVLTSKLKMKLNGWLFISTVLVLTTMPFELYLIFKYDKPFIDTAFLGTGNAQFYIQLIIDRFRVLGSFPIIEIFCFLTVAFLFMFRPFRKKV